jgi:HEAT repeat protein
LRATTTSISSTPSWRRYGIASAAASSAPSSATSSRHTLRARNSASAFPALVFAASFLLALPAFARADEAAPADKAAASADKAAVPVVSLEEQRRDTIRYGIDSEISDLLDKLTTEKEGRYNEDLLGFLKSSRGAKLRTGVLNLFAYLEWKGAEEPAMAIVQDRDNQDPDLVAAALSYLAAARSKEALKFTDAIIKEDNKKLLPSLVKLMGRTGGEAEEKLLLDWFDGDTATPALKEEAIKALGEIGSAKAAVRLAKLAEDPEGGKVPRMYACAALAKIKDESAVPSIVKAANDADPNVRSAAVEALGSFAESSSAAGSEAKEALVQALRDSFPKARIAACKAVASAKVTDAMPFLKYKARNDPERSVKIEALRALATLGGGDADAFLRERLEDKRESPEMRALCFGLLARYDPSGSMESLSSRLQAEAAEKDRSFYTSLAREVANADKAPDIGKLARILIADKEYLIRIAGIEWARKNKSADLRADLERLASSDASDAIRKRAAEALKSY